MFEGFALERVELPEVTLRVRHGGSGPPVVLLHGHPRTHATWHRVAPVLVGVAHGGLPGPARLRRLVEAGDDGGPRAYSKRAMAGDVVALMRRLGHERFAVVGHDRGRYVALRLAMDHPEAVTRLAVLDGVPIVEALERCDARFAAAWWHWFFFAQPEKPERAIIRRPGRLVRRLGASGWARRTYADCGAAIHDPATVRAMLEDYRAGLGVDRADDEADRAAGRRVACPMLVLWSTGDDLA